MEEEDDDADLSRQRDEVEALEAIFGADAFVRDHDRPTDNPPKYSIELKPGSAAADSLTFRVTFPPDYPSVSPPIYAIEGPWLNRRQREILDRRLEQVYLDNVGRSLVFDWIEIIRETLLEWTTSTDDDDEKNDADFPVSHDTSGIHEKIRILGELPEIVSGEPLTDRKSTFQAFLARVSNADEAAAVLDHLKSHRKIGHATHNMWAFRVSGGDSSKPALARCDDDGETHAGGRMMHLLEVMDATDVLVVVSRWYGGIHLGPDRFRHICNLTRTILADNGFSRPKKGGKSGRKK